MRKTATCPVCGKPCVTYMEGAKIYHMACLVKQMRQLRIPDKLVEVVRTRCSDYGCGCSCDRNRG